MLLGLALAAISFLSAAARLLIAVAGPPGGFGLDGRAVVEPADAGGAFSGEVGRGEDYESKGLAASPKNQEQCNSKGGANDQRADNQSSRTK